MSRTVEDLEEEVLRLRKSVNDYSSALSLANNEIDKLHKKIAEKDVIISSLIKQIRTEV